MRLTFLFALLMVAGLVTGCVTTTPPALSIDEARSLKLVAVEGALAQDLNGVWGPVTDDFKKAKGLVTTVKPSEERGVAAEIIEPTLPPAELRAYIQQEFVARVKKAFLGPLQAELRGARPVKIFVTLQSVRILDARTRTAAMLWSGQSGNDNMLVATIAIVDAASGKTILTSASQYASGTGGQGKQFLNDEEDPMMRLLIVLEKNFERWLLTRAS